MADDLLKRADDLDARINAETREVIRDLVEFKSRTRHIAYALAAGFAVLAVVVVVVILAIIKINDNAATIKATCEQQNKAFAKEILLWENILQRSSPNETPEQKQEKVDFENFVNDTFQQVDCRQPKVLP